MIVVKFHGGLGNQMFQYVFYKQLERLYPDIEIKADLSRYNYDKFIEHNGFELEKVFCDICLKKATTVDILKAGGLCERRKNSILDIVIKRLTSGISKMQSLGPLRFKKRLNENDWLLLKEKYPTIIREKSYFLYGYWATPSALSNQLFSFVKVHDIKNLELLGKIESMDSVSIHVRKGDYVGTSMDIVPSEYYVNAKKHLDNIVKTPFYFIFSDDSKFVEKEFALIQNKIIVNWNTNENSYKDMILMSKCKYNIICNSTFSYWAAELNQNKKKIVVVPDFYLKEIEKQNDDRWVGL